MTNVIKFRQDRGKSDAEGVGARVVSGGAKGSMIFTINEAGNDSDMHITGVYEERLQYGIFTLIKGLNRLADMMAATGTVGHFSAGPIHESIPAPKRRTPKRLAEWTDFGDL